MTDQTIPAEKVRELAEKYDNAPGNPDRLLVNAIADLRALLPAPPQPTGGLLGRWAKHDDYGDVVCMWDKPSRFGKMRVAHVSEGKTSGADYAVVRIDSLAFPEQASRPEEVPAGEAWLVNVEDPRESHKSIVAFKYACDGWRTSDEVTNWGRWHDNEVTLISPLTPERPGRGDEQLKPAWRIEHDHTKLRLGEYIIDIGGDDGTLTRNWGSYWDIDGDTYVAPCFAPFIVFPNKAAATPEAIEEAKQARDKEMEK